MVYIKKKKIFKIKLCSLRVFQADFFSYQMVLETVMLELWLQAWFRLSHRSSECREPAKIYKLELKCYLYS